MMMVASNSVKIIDKILQINIIQWEVWVEWEVKWEEIHMHNNKTTDIISLEFHQNFSYHNDPKFFQKINFMFSFLNSEEKI